MYNLAGLERDKFDNKTVSFEEHIKSEHNMWHYLYFMVLVRVKDPTEYTGPESYVNKMIAVSRPNIYTLYTQEMVTVYLCNAVLCSLNVTHYAHLRIHIFILRIY